MPNLWQKADSGTWVPVLPAIKVATGWVNGRFLYEKTGTTTWTLRWSRDSTPPAIPAALTLSYSTTTKKITVTATAPSTSDVRNLRIKVGGTSYPSSPGSTTDGYYYAQGQTDGTPWSDPKAVPSQVVSRVFYPTGTTPVVAPGKTYYFTVWAQDTSNNFGPARTASIKIPVPAAPVPPSVTKSAYVLPVDSGSYTETYGNWRTSDNYVYQAGTQDWRGLWFYSTRLATLLKNAKRINSMSIYIGRVNSIHGVSGGASLSIHGHKYTSQPAGDPVGGYLGTLTTPANISRGEYVSYALPSSWFDDVLSGAMKGFGLRYTNTSYDDSHYAITYGAGTNSGRLYVNWTE